MLYSKTCEYAIRTLSCLAEKGNRFVNVSEIGKDANISASYVAKICQTLARKKFLKSKTGPFGGFMLGQTSDKILVMDIVEAVEDCWVFENCMMGLADCSDDYPCPIHTIWKQAKEHIKTTLENTTLYEVTQKMKNREYRPFERSRLKA